MGKTVKDDAHERLLDSVAPSRSLALATFSIPPNRERSSWYDEA